jgi:fructose-1-phosphate kinase PfkB-like protein
VSICALEIAEVCSRPKTNAKLTVTPKLIKPNCRQIVNIWNRKHQAFDRVQEAHRFADADAAARKIVEIANDVEAVQNGRIYIERVNAPFLVGGGSGQDFRAGIERAIALGWLWLHESGTYLKFTDNGAALFA